MVQMTSLADDDRFELIDLGELDDFDDLDDESEVVSLGWIELKPETDDRNERLDKYVAEKLTDLSRAYIQRLIDEGQVQVDGSPRRRTFKVTPGQTITIQVPEPEIVALVPEDIPLLVIYEDA